MDKFTKTYIYVLVIIIVTWLLLSTISESGKDDFWPGSTPQAIRELMWREGPNYHFRTLFNGTLQIDRGNGWTNVRKEKK